MHALLMGVDWAKAEADLEFPCICDDGALLFRAGEINQLMGAILDAL